MNNSLPEKFIERLEEIYPNNFQQLLNTFSKPKPTTFRANTIKISAEELAVRLSSRGFDLEIDLDIPNSFILKNKTQRELTETEEYEQGLLYIQGLSSMIPALILDPRPNEAVLDSCSAPGSKTTQIAAMMDMKGQIVANDMSRVRLYKLVANIRTLGVTNITTTHFRAQELWRKFPETFDKVLVDVPCSLEGRFNTNYPKSYSQWSIKKLKILADYQKHILRSSIACAKSGATIVYSTCTISPEENEEVIDWILEKEDGKIKIETIDFKIKEHPAIQEWQGKKYNEEVKKCLRILPTDTMEAFFVAKIVKL